MGTPEVEKMPIPVVVVAGTADERRLHANLLRQWALVYEGWAEPEEPKKRKGGRPRQQAVTDGWEAFYVKKLNWMKIYQLPTVAARIRQDVRDGKLLGDAREVFRKAVEKRDRDLKQQKMQGRTEK